MKKLFITFSVLCVICLIGGFVIPNSLIEPFLRAVGAVFFILAFLTKLAEAVEDESPTP